MKESVAEVFSSKIPTVVCCLMIIKKNGDLLPKKTQGETSNKTQFIYEAPKVRQKKNNRTTNEAEYGFTKSTYLLLFFFTSKSSIR